MLNEHKALQAFYKSIGHELDEKVVARKNGVTLHGNFSMIELRLIMDAYEKYQAHSKPEPEGWQLLG